MQVAPAPTEPTRDQSSVRGILVPPCIVRLKAQRFKKFALFAHGQATERSTAPPSPARRARLPPLPSLRGFALPPLCAARRTL